VKRFDIPEDERGLKCKVAVFIPKDLKVEKGNLHQFRSFPDYDSVRNFSVIATGFNKIGEAVDGKTIDGPVFLIYTDKVTHFMETHSSITSSIESEATIEPSGRKIKITIGDPHFEYAIIDRSIEETKALGRN